MKTSKNSFLSSLISFFGGVRFALILIGSTALFVIAGTVIESITDSHQYAAYFTYDNPIFALLLWGYFINILISALRRWPFKLKHVPFLIVHFGLLMILTGTLAKHYFGQQGTMHILEGGGSHQIFESGTYAVSIQSKEVETKYYPLQKNWNGNFKGFIADTEDGLHLRLVNFAPHSAEHFASWIKGDAATITGLSAMPVYHAEEELPISGKVRFQSEPWDVYALKTSDLSETIDRLYHQNAFVIFTDRLTGNVLAKVPLRYAERVPLQGHGAIEMHVALNFSPIDGFAHPTIELSCSKLKCTIPLAGNNALLNLNTQTPYLGSLPFAIDIERTPLLAMLEGLNGDVHLISIDAFGQVWHKPFRQDNLTSLVSYDDGYSGYALRTDFPLCEGDFGREAREKALLNLLKEPLHKAFAEQTSLSPPLHLLQHACQQADVDFVDTCLAFLAQWNNSHRWLYPRNTPISPDVAAALSQINWPNLSTQERQGCRWSTTLFAQLDPLLQKGDDILDILRAHRWPLLAAIEAQHSQPGRCTPEETLTILGTLTQQLFAAASALPNQPLEESQDQATLLSAYFRAYGIHLSNIVTVEAPLLTPETLTLETSLIAMQTPLPAIKKLEDNFPKIVVHAAKDHLKQTLSLGYDRIGNGLKWPILNGQYLVLFQPAFVDIPYHVRLRTARQINYANSNQPYSFESDLIITDRRDNTKAEKTISMNHVHETWDGYRFYLSAIAPPGDGVVKRVHIVVNYDPAKYWLTYPGAFILSCGIILLFLQKLKKRNAN